MEKVKAKNLTPEEIRDMAQAEVARRQSQIDQDAERVAGRIVRKLLRGKFYIKAEKVCVFVFAPRILLNFSYAWELRDLIVERLREMTDMRVHGVETTSDLGFVARFYIDEGKR